MVFTDLERAAVNAEWMKDVSPSTSSAYNMSEEAVNQYHQENKAPFKGARDGKRGKQEGSSGVQNGLETRECYECHQKGHLARDCAVRKRRTVQKKWNNFAARKTGAQNQGTRKKNLSRKDMIRTRVGYQRRSENRKRLMTLQGASGDDLEIPFSELTEDERILFMQEDSMGDDEFEAYFDEVLANLDTDSSKN